MIETITKRMNISLLFCLLFHLFSINNLLAQSEKELDELIIEKGSEWSYHDQTYLNSKEWFKQQFLPKSGWKSGKAPLGYNMDNLGTTIGFGQDSVKKVLTSYFHKTFYIENASEYYAYKLKVRRDDGAIIYLNGKEVWRTNMPNFNKISDKTKAENRITGKDEKKYYPKVLFPNNFIDGINVLAVEIHQRNGNTSDCVFDLELKGTNDLSFLKAFLENQDNQNIALRNEIKDLNYKLELERYEKDISNLKTRKIIMDAIMLILLLALIILGVFTYRLFREKIQAVSTTQNLKESINLKEKELLNLSLRNIQNVQQLELVGDDLSKIVSGFDGKQNLGALSDLKALNKTISQNLGQKDEWLELQKHFDLVHSGFFTRLNKEFPSLTQTEMRHCSLIRLHLSTKEIAKHLNINPKSVQASRYRIKKKMQLEESVDLKDYFLNY